MGVEKLCFFVMKIGSLAWLLWQLRVSIDINGENRKMGFTAEIRQEKSQVIEDILTKLL